VEGGYVKGTCPWATCPGREGYMPGEGGLHARGLNAQQ